MTLSELDDTLPNGLLDAYLTGLSVSFCDATATFGILLLVSVRGEKARHQAAEIRLSGLLVLAIEGPESSVGPLSKPLGVSSFITSDQHYPKYSSFPQDVREYFLSFYVEDPWNSFIHIAATAAQIEWKTLEQVQNDTT